DAGKLRIVVIEGQRKMQDVAAGLPTDCELSDCEFSGFQYFGEVGPAGRGRSPEVGVRVAESIAVRVNHDEADEPRKSPLDPGEVSVASVRVLRLYRRELRERDQRLMHSHDDLPLLRCGELRQVERLGLHLDLARVTQLELIVCLNRN